MGRLVFITQQADPAHPVLAATVAKIAALARRVDSLCVLADSADPSALPPNCRVRTFAAPTKSGRGLRFERALVAELRLRPAAIVAHMCPIYAVLAAPLARPLGIPLLLWYAHWHASATLRAAVRLSTAVLSVDSRSFPLPSRKVRAIGHGIDLAEFPCVGRPENSRLEAIALGRYSPSKGLETIIRAVSREGLDVRLRVHGPASSELELAHRDELERLVRRIGAGDRVELGGVLPRAELPALFATTDLLIDNMRAGAPDKVVYEAAASCLPVLASNPVFDDLLAPAQRFAREDDEELTNRLRTFAALDRDARVALGQELRSRVAQRHSVEHWAECVLAAAALG